MNKSYTSLHGTYFPEIRSKIPPEKSLLITTPSLTQKIETF
jgi:hypothetical protein